MESLKKADRALTAALQLRPKLLGPFMVTMALVGSPFIVIVLGFCGAVTALLAGRYDICAGYALASAALLVNTAIKITVRRERPVTAYSNVMKYKTFSFPSGHTFGSTVVFGMYALSGLALGGFSGLLLASIMGLLVLSIGFSRVYLGAHYVSDVVGGWLFGTVVLGLIQVMVVTI